MNVVLAKDETILKSWDYAKAGNRFEKDKQQANLTLTNKRIVSTISNRVSLSIIEIPMESVKSFSGGYSQNRSFWLIVKLVFSIIFSFVLIGIPMLIKTIKQLKAVTFNLIINTRDVEGSPLIIGAAAQANMIKRKKTKGLNKFVVIVDKNQAKEILSELGSILIGA